MTIIPLLYYYSKVTTITTLKHTLSSRCGLYRNHYDLQAQSKYTYPKTNLSIIIYENEKLNKIPSPVLFQWAKAKAHIVLAALDQVLAHS